jgi:hypothetical protein
LSPGSPVWPPFFSRMPCNKCYLCFKRKQGIFKVALGLVQQAEALVEHADNPEKNYGTALGRLREAMEAEMQRAEISEAQFERQGLKAKAEALMAAGPKTQALKRKADKVLTILGDLDKRKRQRGEAESKRQPEPESQSQA